LPFLLSLGQILFRVRLGTVKQFLIKVETSFFLTVGLNNLLHTNFATHEMVEIKLTAGGRKGDHYTPSL